MQKENNIKWEFKFPEDKNRTHIFVELEKRYVKECESQEELVKFIESKKLQQIYDLHKQLEDKFKEFGYKLFYTGNLD